MSGVAQDSVDQYVFISSISAYATWESSGWTRQQPEGADGRPDE
ncbi:MAG: hypothetical protein R3B46_01335 [Phycisphaerales bacterium]